MTQTRKWYRKRVFLSVAATVVAFVSVALLWGFQTANYLSYRHRAKRFPVLNYRPVALQNAAVNRDSGMTLAHRGLSFEVPWTGLNQEKSKIVGTWAIFSFDSGVVITFCAPSSNGEDLRDVLAEQFGVSQDKMVTSLGIEADSTNYALHRALLNATVSDLRPWMGWRQSMRMGVVLMFKAISSVGGDTGLFSVAANDWKGFQFDDPIRSPRRVTLELYDAKDKHVEISIAHRLDMKNPPAQADVNRILHTLQWSDSKDTLHEDPAAKTVAAR